MVSRFSKLIVNKSTQHPAYGILLILASTVLFACHDGVSKYLTGFYAPVLVVWARFMTQTLLTVGVFGPKLGLRIFHTSQLKLQIVRGICMLAAGLFFVFGLRFVPMGEATAVVFLAPILITWYSARILKEHIRLGQWVAVVFGLVGVVVIVRPGSALFTPGILLPLCASFCMAAFQLLTRKLLLTDHIVATNFITSVVCVLLLSPIVGFVWQTPTFGAFFLALLGGSLAMVGHMMLIYSYRFASVATLAPFSYTQIIFATLVGFLFFEHAPDRATMFGMAIIMLSGAGLIWWQRR